MSITRDSEKEPLLRNNGSSFNNGKCQNGSIEPTPQKITPRRAYAMWFGLVFYTCGITMGMAAMRQYTYKYVQDSKNETVKNESSKAGCGANTTSSGTEKEASNWLLYFQLTEYSIVLPVVAVCGVYSDFIGRKPFIIVVVVGGVLQYACFSTFIFFKLPLKYLFIGYTIGGLCGAERVMFMACSAAIADTTEDSKTRSYYMAMVFFLLWHWPHIFTNWSWFCNKILWIRDSKRTL